MEKKLSIQQVDMVALAKKVGTPLMVYDQVRLEQRLQAYRQYFTSKEFQCDVLYASKAFQ